MKSMISKALVALLILSGGVGVRAQSIPLADGETSAGKTVHIATFDSGFGGFFTAKEIEKRMQGLARQGYGPFTIAHYEDTTHLPYGEKTPDQIARYASEGILTAFHDGARDVYVGCNTASTQMIKIKEILRAEDPAYANHVHSIIEISVAEVMKTISAQLKSRDVARVLVVATPATVKSETYPKALAKALHVEFKPGVLVKHTQPRWLQSKGGMIDSYTYRTELALGPKKEVVIEQIAPANWVEMIENGATDADKQAAVHRDLALLDEQMGTRQKVDVVGEFCTHYPALDARIQTEMKARGMVAKDAPFVVQGPLMADLFTKQFLAGKPVASSQPVAPPTTPPIYLSGTNVNATRRLVQQIFPTEPVPEIETKKFAAVK